MEDTVGGTATLALALLAAVPLPTPPADARTAVDARGIGPPEGVTEDCRSLDEGLVDGG